MNPAARSAAIFETRGGRAPSGPIAKLLVLASLALLAGLALAATASATPVEVNMGTATGATFTTVHVTGEVNPHNEPNEWFYEVSSDGGANWERKNLQGGVEGTTFQPVPGTIEGLAPETTYRVRLSDFNYNEGIQVSSLEPSPEFTTNGPVVPPTSVAIDPVSTFTGTSAHLSGKIDPGAAQSDPGFSVQWHFECQPACVGFSANGGGGSFVDDGVQHTVEMDATVEPNTAYTIKLVAANAGGTISDETQFTSSKAPPLAVTLPAFAIEGGTKALLGGRVNPRNDATTYWVEYGTTTGYDHKFPLTPVAVGSGAVAQYATQEVTGLTPSTVYHFTLVAENSAGPAEGLDMNFETPPAGPPAQNCPNATLRTENNSNALPECRAYEQVTPTDKNGYDAGINSVGGAPFYTAGQAGGAIAFESFGAFGDTVAAPFLNSFLSRRSASGWSTHNLGVPLEPQPFTQFSAVTGLSANLDSVVLHVPRALPQAPGAASGEENDYLMDPAKDTLTTLLAGNDGGFLSATPDFKTILLHSPRSLTPGAPTGGINTQNIYEWRNGQYTLASVLPGGTPSPEGGLLPGNTKPWMRNISDDGSRMLWENGFAGTLYLREGGESYEIFEGGLAQFYVGSSADLSQVFFTSEFKLTPDGSNGVIQIYRYDAATKKLTLITPHLAAGAVGVYGVGPVSNDGHYIYFLAQGQYNAGEGSVDEKNLYVWHDGEISLIGTEPSGQAISFAHDSYRASADGKLFSFTTRDRMTSYDNTDTTLDENEQPRSDEEVYEYNAELHRLTCVSCDPSGERPEGSPGGLDASASFPSPPERLGSVWQPGVRNDGKIFFNTRDALVPEDVNGKTDIYEWAGGRVYLISGGSDGDVSFLASSSESGDDLYIATRQQLVAGDVDGNFDIYDARVDGGFPKAVPPSPCEGIDGCHGAASAAAPFNEPHSRSFSSSLKAPSPQAQRLQNALKACRHKKGKKAKAKCKASAKHRFGKGSTGRAH